MTASALTAPSPSRLGMGTDGLAGSAWLSVPLPTIGDAFVWEATGVAGQNQTTAAMSTALKARDAGLVQDHFAKFKERAELVGLSVSADHAGSAMGAVFSILRVA